MFQRFHAMRERREGGFTLIELLVVILIIAILAAIAIPVFLNQRKKGWAAASESAVKNAATAEESYATGANGAYTTDVTLLRTQEGLRYDTSKITVTANVDNTNGAYCIKSVHSSDTTGSVRYYHSADGRPLASGNTNTNPACP